MSDIENVVIIGSGPAGHTAAIYCARANLKPFMFEGFYSGIAGGQLMTTTDVENYPGFPEGVTGPELMDNFRKQSVRFGTQIVTEDVIEVDLSQTPFVVKGSNRVVKTHTIIIATGANAKKLEIPGAGEGEFWQKGVTACAVCDGAMPIFRDKDLYVVGGGDTAVEEAMYLTKFASKVYIVHRRDELRASKIMAKRAFDHDKVEILWDSEVTKVSGDNVVKSVTIKNIKTGEEVEKNAGGLFFAIGHEPNTKFLGNQLKLHDNGYINIESNSAETSVAGVFAAGDVHDFQYRQAVTAAGSGCRAALEAERWLAEKGHS
ncbi:MAG: thioredoxin-disulfide reductase [Rhabdochlamydiaceae bacterium]|nr:thioredoxin-disulfide reductase [Candidatus Amphrikana amoebophyrae]